MEKGTPVILTAPAAVMEPASVLSDESQSTEVENGTKAMSSETSNGNKEKQLLQGEKVPSSSAPTILASKPPSTAADTIDSALLAALRDPRERLGLLKLEQTLIDFLEKQPQDSYVDIGGPYNSTVISPTLGYIGQQAQQQIQQPNGEGNTGRPQTTFQRCILHRICDRFSMTRENSYTTDAFGCYLIRVCKGPDSKKPARRLLNVKESEYQIQRPSPPENTNGGSSALASGFSQMTLASSSSNPNGMANNNAGPMNPTSSKGKVRKMKIMKRSSSNVSNSSNSSGNGKAKNASATTKTRSSLSEKEKKYAEARARIFEQEKSNGESTEDTTNLGVSTQNNTTNDNRGFRGYYNNNNNEGYNSQYHTNNYNQSSSTSPTATEAPLHNNSTTSLNSMSSSNSDGGDAQPSSTTTRSKATYRNRQQEETDPDFRRGAGMQFPQTTPYSHAVASVGYAGAGRGGANTYYPNSAASSSNGNGVTSNNHRIGYGYGQQQAPSQQQQQTHYQYHHSHHPQQQQQHYNSAVQQQQAHFYPGLASQNMVSGRGYPHGHATTSLQYQQQRRHQEQHYPALSSTTSRK